MKRFQGKKQPQIAAVVHALRDGYSRSIEPAHVLATEALMGVRTKVRHNYLPLCLNRGAGMQESERSCFAA